MMGASTAVLPLVLLVALAGTTASCRDCTQMSCQDGLTFTIDGDVPSNYRLTLEVDQVPLTIDCTASTCGGSVFIPEFTPALVTITIETASSTVTEQFTPQYRDFRPNGSDCPPTCRVADVEVSL